MVKWSLNLKCKVQVVISSIDWLRVWFKFDCVEHSLDGELLLIIVGSLCISTIIIVIVVIIFTIFTILIIFIIVIMFIIVTLFTCHTCHHHNFYNFLDQGCGKLLHSYFICEWMKWIESSLPMGGHWHLPQIFGHSKLISSL